MSLDEKMLHVRATVLDINGQAPTTKVLKTKAGWRSVTLPDVVIDVLRDHRGRQLEMRVALVLGRP